MDFHLHVYLFCILAEADAVDDDKPSVEVTTDENEQVVIKVGVSLPLHHLPIVLKWLSWIHLVLVQPQCQFMQQVLLYGCNMMF